MKSDLEQQLIDAVWDDASDLNLREVYADWLQDVDPARAKCVRADLRLAALGPDDPDHLEAWEALSSALDDVDPTWVRRVLLHYDLTLHDPLLSRKILAIKEVRLVASIGLREAKELVESTPTQLLGGVHGAHAEAVRQLFATLHPPEQQPLGTVTLHRLEAPASPAAPVVQRRRQVLVRPGPDRTQARAALRQVGGEALAAKVDELPGPVAETAFPLDALLLERRLIVLGLEASTQPC